MVAGSIQAETLDVGGGDLVVDNGGNVGIGTTSPAGLLDVGGGDLFVDANSGNVGIGTTSPTERLDVAGTVKATSFIGDGSQLTGISGSGQWSDGTGSIYYNGGNVGIGTTTPQQKMHLSGVMRLEPQSSAPSGALGDLYVGTDGKLYFHNGTQWKEVSLL